MIQKFFLRQIETENKPGILCPLNIEDINNKLNINFNINNLFYIKDLNSLKSRGNHANINTREILVCVKGSFDIICFDGNNKRKYSLKETECIYIPELIWLDFNNFKDCIILVLTSIKPFINKNSIYNKEEFIKFINDQE